jgi:hypothetical protein
LNFAIGQTIIPENFPENSTFGKRVNGGARRGDREAEAVALSRRVGGKSVSFDCRFDAPVLKRIRLSQTPEKNP